MSDNVLNFVRCQWCTSGNAADMGHWGKCPGAAERDKAAEARVAAVFDRLTVYYEGDDRPDDAVPLYRLVPIEETT